MEQVTIQVHGQSKGNPGPAAIGVIMTYPKGVVLVRTAESVGNAFDDYATHYAVMRGLQLAVEHFDTSTKQQSFILKLCNKTVKQQLNAEVEITHPGLVPIFIQIHNLKVTHFPHITVKHVHTKENLEVEQLVREVLDGQEKRR